MKLQYFGTAAAEGWPALFCDCDACRRAKAAGGRNIRTRSQALIDDRLLIDFPADTYLHVLHYGLDLNRVDAVIVTHAHEDHFYPKELGNRRNGFAHLPEDAPRTLTVYGSEKIGKALASVIAGAPGRIAFEQLEIGEASIIAGYSVTPLPADHNPASGPVIYLIGDGKSNLLYAHDTGYFPEETVAFSGNVRLRADRRFARLHRRARRAVPERPYGNGGLPRGARPSFPHGNRERAYRILSSSFFPQWKINL